MKEKTMYSQYRWIMLLSVCLSVMSCYIDMIAYAPILGDIAKSLKIEIGLATNLMMGFVLAIAFVLMWGGVVCDKYGVTTALVLGLACATIPATFMPIIGTSYETVLVARLIQGASVGFIFAVIGPILVFWFPQIEQGIAGGLMIGSISLGSAIGVLVSPAIFSATGNWQTTVAIMSILGWIALIFTLIATRKQPNPEVVNAVVAAIKAGGAPLTLGKAFSFSQTWVATIVMICNAWGLYCLYNLVPPYLAAPSPVGIGLGPGTSGAISVAVTIIGLFAMIVGGIFFDKVFKGNSRPAIAIGFILTGIFSYFVLLPSIYSNMSLLILSLLVAGWGIPFMNPSVSAFVSSNYPPSMVGRMIGFIFGFGTFGGALGLYLGGKSIAATGNFQMAITMISIAAFVGLITSFFLKPKK